MPKCIFCDSILDDTTKPEHILLNALGGRKTTKNAICSACNNQFGGTIDDALTSQVIEIRNLLGLESGTGKPAPALKNLQAGDLTVNMRGDGNPELVAKPFTIEKVGDGRWNVQVTARSEEHLREIMPHLAAALRISEDDLGRQMAAGHSTTVTQRPGLVHHSLLLGGPDAIRSAVKAALVLLSTIVGNNEVKSAAYEAARRFVVSGDDEFLRNRTHEDLRFFPYVEKMKAAYGLIFNLIYVKSDVAGRVIGHFTLDNAVAWQFVLAESGGSKNVKVALISNPLDPNGWSERAADEFHVPFDWLDNPDNSNQTVRATARVESIVKHYFEVTGPQAQRSIIEDCFRKLNVPPEGTVPPERINEFAALLATRLTHHYLGVPYREELSPDRLVEMLKGKN